MKVSGSVVPVIVNGIVSRYNPISKRKTTIYHCTNLKTNRGCVAHSASKFRGPAPDPSGIIRAKEAILDKTMNSKPEDRMQSIEGKQGSDPTTPSTTPTATAAVSTPEKPVDDPNDWFWPDENID